MTVGSVKQKFQSNKNLGYQPTACVQIELVTLLLVRLARTLRVTTLYGRFPGFAWVPKHVVVDVEIREAAQPVNSRSAKRPSPERAARCRLDMQL